MSKKKRSKKSKAERFKNTKAGMPLLSRTFWYQPDMDSIKTPGVRAAYGRQKPKRKLVEEATEANLVGSQLVEPEGAAFDDEERHGFCVDIDLPCALIESSPGHYHLYIERDLPWSQYERVLRALADAGIIEQGYYQAANNHRGTFLRKNVYDRFFSDTGKDYEVLAAATREVLKEVE